MINQEPGKSALKSIKVVPHVPFFSAPGCVTRRLWDSEFVDKMGNKATLCNIEYADKKGGVHEAVIRVRWHA